jgi:hypothetical protein
MRNFEDYVKESSASDLADNMATFAHKSKSDAMGTGKALGSGKGAFQYDGPNKKYVGKWYPGKDYAAFAKFINGLK